MAAGSRWQHRQRSSKMHPQQPYPSSPKKQQNSSCGSCSWATKHRPPGSDHRNGVEMADRQNVWSPGGKKRRCKERVLNRHNTGGNSAIGNAKFWTAKNSTPHLHTSSPKPYPRGHRPSRCPLGPTVRPGWPLPLAIRPVSLLCAAFFFWDLQFNRESTSEI